MTDLRLDAPFLLGRAAALQQVLRAARLVAATDVTVLIQGESGTGKELLARFVHAGSAQAAGPFVAINCAAIPDQLLESELFGYRRGAFTGATQDYAGRIRAAAGGTLFLDEIGELSLMAQAKLLRFLESGEIHPVGEARPVTVRTRLIAATHRNLLQLVREQRFRADLYYRLQVVPLEMPPLRERIEDIPLLFAHYAAEAAARYGRPCVSLDRRALARLTAYAWPGNVRELKNLCERLTVLHGEAGVPLGPACLPAEFAEAVPAAGESLGLFAAERRLIEEALQQARGNRSQAARLLGISRDTLLYRLKKYRLA